MCGGGGGTMRVMKGDNGVASKEMAANRKPNKGAVDFLGLFAYHPILFNA